MNIKDFDKFEDLIDQTAKTLWKRSYRLCNHVFGMIEDMKQVGWTRMLESKKGRELLEVGVEGQQGLICTIVKRGMLDYIRSVLGREDQNSSKGLQLYMTTYYMDYYLEGHGSPHDMLDIMLPSENREEKSPENTVIAKLLLEEVEEFMRNKLSRRDKMIMDYLHKNDHNRKEVGKKFKVTESRVSQLRTKAIQKVRQKYAQE